MIFRFHLAFGAFDAERAQILAQSRQRPLVEKAGEIIRAVRKQLAAPDADEKIEKLALDLFDARILCGFAQEPHARRPTVLYHREAGDATECGRIRCARQQHREQCVFLRADFIDIVDLSGLLSASVGPQKSRATSITVSTDNSRVVRLPGVSRVPKAVNCRCGVHARFTAPVAWIGFLETLGCPFPFFLGHLVSTSLHGRLMDSGLARLAVVCSRLHTWPALHFSTPNVSFIKIRDKRI